MRLATAAVAVVAVGSGAWLVHSWRATPSAPARAPRFTVIPGSEQQILGHNTERLTVFSFDADPKIIVLDFPTLQEQGEMLDRVAALVEKARLPRDRVLDTAELDAAIRASGDTVSTWYYGHDYPAAAIKRFFALADARHVHLNTEEERLRALADQLGWFGPAPLGALISIPQAGNPRLTMAARGAILHHELSHGAFFTNPAYAQYVHDFWRLALTPTQRAQVRTFLGSEGYDTTDEELMFNEMQAYLFFTPDPAFFQAKNVGMNEEERLALRERFLGGMPAGWLKQMLRRTALPAAASISRAASRP